MPSARDDILSAIRRRHRRAASVPAALARPDPLVPARGRVAPAARVETFRRMAVEQAATVETVPSFAAVPGAVAAFLGGTAVRVAPALAGLDWSGLPATPGAAAPDDAASVTPAFAGVAETGTLVLLSGPDSPTGLNFLPDIHVVVLRAGDVLGCYEEVWERLRARGPLPRSVNMITGPSRTGDIEQTIQLGAHGPRRLHIIVVDDRPGA